VIIIRRFDSAIHDYAVYDTSGTFLLRIHGAAYVYASLAKYGIDAKALYFEYIYDEYYRRWVNLVDEVSRRRRVPLYGLHLAPLYLTDVDFTEVFLLSYLPRVADLNLAELSAVADDVLDGIDFLDHEEAAKVQADCGEPLKFKPDGVDWRIEACGNEAILTTRRIVLPRVHKRALA
jgi:hypothetical protein